MSGLERLHRIPLHNHADNNSGGRIDASTVIAAVGGSGSLGGGGAGTPGPPGADGSSMWFNVMDYGATGDGTTDDTSAINLAIAALVSAGSGVLYFPAGVYKCTSTLTALSVPCLVLGDGANGTPLAQTDAVSRITFTSATAVLFSVTANHVSFSRLAFHNTAASTPSAGAAIQVPAGGASRSRGYDAIYEDCSFFGFWINIDLEEGGEWAMRDCQINYPVKYGVRTLNTTSPDEGDWSMVGCWFSSATTSPDAAIRIESGGGGKIVNCKINGSPASGYARGIDVAISNGIATSVFLVANTSIENLRGGNGINLATAGTGAYGKIVLNGIQFGLSATSIAINISANTLGEIYDVLIDNIIGSSGANSNPVIALTKVQTVRIGSVVNDGFASVFTQTGSSGVVDDTGAIAAGVAITGTPSSGQIPLASGAAAAAWASLATASIAPNTVDYLVGTASAGLTSEIAVGTTPGGELGNTWASPTVDTTHSGSSHADAIATAEAYTDVAIAASGGGHAHVVGETHLSDGSTTTYTLDEQFEPGSVEAFNTTTLAYLVVTEAQPDQATVSAAGSSGDKITFSYAATVA